MNGLETNDFLVFNVYGDSSNLVKDKDVLCALNDLGGPIPQKLAQAFDGPPTLERSGPELRVGRFPPSLLRREGRGERWSLL